MNHSLARAFKDGEKLNFRFLCLLLFAAFIFLNLITHNFGKFVFFPGIMLFGYTLIKGVNAEAKKKFWFCFAALVWLFICEICRSGISELSLHVYGVYMLALPFAALLADEKRGLKVFAIVFIVAGLVLGVYSAALIAGVVPESQSWHMYMIGARLFVLRHPNVNACIFMIAIGFSLMLMLQEEKLWKKILLAAAIVALITFQSLTNSRSSILFTYVLVGGTAFFHIARGGFKRFCLGVIAAAIILGGLFLYSNTIWNSHNNNLVEKMLSEQTVERELLPDGKEETGGSSSAAEDERNKLDSEGGQGSFLRDVWTLNNRFYIWRGTLKAIDENPSILICGTGDVASTISANMEHGLTAPHTHNSWLNVLMSHGVPGLVMALILTVMAIVNIFKTLFTPGRESWKKAVAILIGCIMCHSFLEPFLFYSGSDYFYIDFVFLLCLGYLSFWNGKKVECE